jgi:hypothetical protein
MTHEHDDTRTPIDGGSEPLDEARSLPRAIEPERDLWPGIAARLERPAAAPEPARSWRREAAPARLEGGRDGTPSRSWRYWQLAAAAALVAVLAGTGFGLMRLLDPEAPDSVGPTAGDEVTAPTDRATPGGAETAAAAGMSGAGTFGNRLMAALERKRNQLGPETSDAVEADIARLGMAMAEILTALGDHPNDPALYHHLAARQRQEADLLLRLNQL